MRVLFVCRGNTCRSPMAEGVFRKYVTSLGLVHRIEVDSAGTHAGDIPRPPDPRAQATARARAIDISMQRSRTVTAADFLAFDLLIAMDASVKAALIGLAPAGDGGRIRGMMEFAAHMGLDEVPDPWFGTEADYEHAMDLITAGCDGLIETLALVVEP